jgi:type IV pilus assembly protein PilY1
VTGVQYARAMDWDVPPTEFAEYVTHAGVSIGGTSNLLRATDNGFADADPTSAIFDGGIAAVPNTNGDQGGVDDHGSLFVFGFPDLDDGESVTFQIYYGAGANRADALALVGAAGVELYSFGQSSGCTSSPGTSRCDDLPTYIFAFSGVGLPPVVPAPAALGLFGLGLLGLGLAKRRRA